MPRHCLNLLHDMCMILAVAIHMSTCGEVGHTWWFYRLTQELGLVARLFYPPVDMIHTQSLQNAEGSAGKVRMLYQPVYNASSCSLHCPSATSLPSNHFFNRNNRSRKPWLNLWYLSPEKLDDSCWKSFMQSSATCFRAIQHGLCKIRCENGRKEHTKSTATIRYASTHG